VQELKLTVSLNRCHGVQQGDGINEVLWLRHQFDNGVDGPMVATPVVLVSVVVSDGQWTVRVVFDHDPVRVGGTLVLFVHVPVLVSLPLVGGHKLDFVFFVAREDRLIFSSDGQLV